VPDSPPAPESPEETRNDDDAVIDPLETPLGQTLYASDPPPTSSAPPPPLPAPKKRFRRGR
jgi:hypothetical protein